MGTLTGDEKQSQRYIKNLTIFSFFYRVTPVAAFAHSLKMNSFLPLLCKGWGGGRGVRGAGFQTGHVSGGNL